MKISTLQSYAAATNQTVEMRGDSTRVDFYKFADGWETMYRRIIPAKISVLDMSVKNKRQEFVCHFQWDQYGASFTGRENTGAGTGAIQCTWKKEAAFKKHVAETLGLEWSQL